MRLPDAAHTDQPWRIHELTDDFRLVDVWSYRTPGAGPDDFPVMLAAMEAAGAPAGQSPVVRFLFAVRFRLGALFRWDRRGATRAPSLRDRLPDDLRPVPDDPGTGRGPFTTAYRLDDECARELANRTVHTVMHLGWAPAADGGRELRMAVLVKPDGLLGRLYMAAIAPLRTFLVHPALARQWEGAWRDRDRPSPDGAAAGRG